MISAISGSAILNLASDAIVTLDLIDVGGASTKSKRLVLPMKCK